MGQSGLGHPCRLLGQHSFAQRESEYWYDSVSVQGIF